jgi:hypothetical protein
VLKTERQTQLGRQEDNTNMNFKYKGLGECGLDSSGPGEKSVTY